MISRIIITFILLTFSRGLIAQLKEDNLSIIIVQLNLNRDSIPLDLVAIKEYPNNENLIIFCIPSIVEFDCEKECWTANVFVGILNNSTNKIVYQNFERNLISDAVFPTKIWIDTAPYRISTNKRAFGIRIEMRNNSRAAYYSGEEFWLVTNDISIERLLKLDSKTTITYGGGDCKDTEVHKQKSIFIISEETNNTEYFNIIEKLNYQHYFLTQDCDDGEKKLEQYKNIFTFNNGEYKIIGERKKGW